MKKFIFMICSLITTSSFAAEGLEWIATEYNQNIQTSENLIHYVSHNNKNQGEALKKYFKENDISSSVKIPKLRVVDNYLTFENDNELEFKMIPSKDGGFDISYKKKRAHFQSSLSINEAQALLNNLLRKNEKTSFINLFISDVYADGALEAAGMAFSGITSTVAIVGLYGTAFVVDSFNKLKSLPKERSDQKLREQVDQACNDIIEGKKVKDATKLRLKLEKLKSEDECVDFWPAGMIHSCKWYENNLNCLAHGAAEIVDNKREAKKLTVESPTETKSTSSVSK